MKILVALLFIFILNLLMYGTQLATNDIATSTALTSPTIIDLTGTPLDDASNGQQVAPNNPGELIPEASASGLAAVGAFILYPFQVVFIWLLGAGSFFFSIITAFPTFLAAMHFPAAYVWMLGTTWYILISTLLILVAFGHY